MNKMIICLTLTLFIVLQVFYSTNIYANEFITSDGFVFDKSTETITDYSGKEDNVIVPSVIDGINVRAIGDRAFSSANKMSAVFIPPNISSISNSAFNWCESLERIDVSSESAYFTSKEGVLYSKDMTKLIRYPQGKKDKSFTMPDAVNYIDRNAFYSVNILVSINIADGLKHIGESAFYQCRYLIDIKLPDSIKIIEKWAFNQCFRLSI